MEVFRNELQEQGQPNTFRDAVLAACTDMQQLLTLASTNAWLQAQLGQIQNVPGIIEYLQQLNAQNPENIAVPVPLLTVQLAALGLAEEPSTEGESQMAPHAADVWAMIAVCPPSCLVSGALFFTAQPYFEAHYTPVHICSCNRNGTLDILHDSVLRRSVECMQTAEHPGMVPSESALAHFLSPTMPGMQLKPSDADRSRLELLKQAVSSSLDHVSNHLSLQHGVDCELQELSAVAFFMHQISLQVHIMYKNLPAARWALTLLTARPHDDASHVHTWYWAAAVANHCKEWWRARKLFMQAARCTLEYPHMAMRAKSLVGVCETILAEVVAASCPQLQAEQFVLACSLAEPATAEGASVCQDLQQTAQGSRCAAEVHCELCRSLLRPLQEQTPEFPSGRMSLLKTLVEHALLDAEAAHDPGAELRALLVTRVLLEIEGLVTFAQGKLVWDATAKPTWCLVAPRGLGARVTLHDVERRFAQRMAHMQRNTFVTRSLLGCSVVVDPDAMWDMACALR